MGLKDWIAPFITLLIGASTIFISYKNYQAQAAAPPTSASSSKTTGSSSNVPPSNRSYVKSASTATACSACS